MHESVQRRHQGIPAGRKCKVDMKMGHSGFHNAQQQGNRIKTGSENKALGQPLVITKPRGHSMFSSTRTEKIKQERT